MEKVGLYIIHSIEQSVVSKLWFWLSSTRTQDIVDNAFIRCLPNNYNESNKYTKDTRLTRKITDLFHQKFPSKHNDTPKVPFHGDPVRTAPN
jgi:hypothetical protein